VALTLPPISRSAANRICTLYTNPEQENKHTKEGTPLSAANQYITGVKGNRIAAILRSLKYRHLKAELHDL